MTAFLGLQSLEGPNPNNVSRSIVEVIYHPNYNPISYDNDVALVRLSSPVPFNDFIRPVCLAANGSTFFTGIESWVTGWGKIGEGGQSTSAVQSWKKNNKHPYRVQNVVYTDLMKK